MWCVLTDSHDVWENDIFFFDCLVLWSIWLQGQHFYITLIVHSFKLFKEMNYSEEAKNASSFSDITLWFLSILETNRFINIYLEPINGLKLGHFLFNWIGDAALLLDVNSLLIIIFRRTHLLLHSIDSLANSLIFYINVTILFFNTGWLI